MIKCRECRNCHFVSKAEIKKNRFPIWEVLRKANQELREECKLGFSAMVVGSSKRLTAIRTGSSIYDHDIQLKFESKKELDASIKNDVFEAIKKAIPNGWKIELSSSVITARETDDKGKIIRTFDLAIINRGKLIAKGKTMNNFIWNESPNVNEAHLKWKQASREERDEIKQRYIDHKCKQRLNFAGAINPKDAPNYRTSSEWFVESINEVI